MLDFTVAICTYNGANRVGDVLEKLRSQIGTEELTWEILIIDNNSNDHTAEVIQNYISNWSEPYPLKYYFEPNQGLAFARQKAVEESQGELIGFIDDDVFPANNWVLESCRFGKEHPNAGAYGGQIHGNFEVEPPKNFTRIKSFLAIRERGSKAHLYSPDKLNLPPGAALVIRKQAWYGAVPNRLMLMGRVNGSTLAGEDFEALLHLSKANWEIWYNPTMHSDHQISAKRLEKDYLISLVRGCGLCICQLQMVKTKNWQKPLIMMRIFLGSVRRLFSHIIKYRWEIKTDLITSCELEFIVSNLVSPFYYLKILYLNFISPKNS